jgi:predicted nucleic acid-binding Zn ribbon protein
VTGDPRDDRSTGEGRFGAVPGDRPVDAVDNSAPRRPVRRPARPDPGGEQVDGPSPTVHTRDPARSGPAHEQTSRADTDGPTPGGTPRGADIARAALDAARAAAAARRGEASPRTGRRAGARTPGTRIGGARRRGWSGARPDDRDPQTLGRAASRLSAQRGWAPRLSRGTVFGRWSEIVGDEVAEHATPTALRDGELTVQADSTAWATQLRLLQRQLLARIAAALGDGVVTSMRVQGPSAPSWRRGPRHVSGRGPRDTYG